MIIDSGIRTEAPVRAAFAAVVVGLAAAACVVAAPASAATSGDFSYSDEGASVTITGCSASPCPQNLTIPGTISGKPVSAIGATAFIGDTSVKTVSIPSSVRTIGSSAFLNNTALTSVTLTDGLLTIGDYAFYGATSLGSITIPSSVTDLGMAVFANDTSLTSVTFAPGCKITALKSSFLMFATGVTSLRIPAKVASIENSAFSGATGIKTITFEPGSVLSTINDSSFSGTTSLERLTIPASVTTIESAGLGNQPNLESITFEPGSKLVDAKDSAFWNNPKLRSINLPSGLKSLPKNAFYTDASLVSVTLPKGLTSIGDTAFFDATSLENVTFKGPAPTIGAAAFVNIAAGARAYRQAQLTGYGATGSSFHGMTVRDDEGFTYSDNGTQATLTGCTASPCDPVLLLPSVIGGLPVTTIGQDAFSGLSGLTAVSIPASVTLVGKQAFAADGNLGAVTFRGNAPTVGPNAFTGVKAGARAYRSRLLTGFPNAGLLFNGLVVSDPDNRITPAAPQGRVTRTLITLTTRVSVPGPGQLTQTVTGKSGRKVVTRCTAQARPAVSGSYTLTCSIGKPGRKALTKGALAFTLTTEFTPAGGVKSTKVQALKLKRTR